MLVAGAIRRTEIWFGCGIGEILDDGFGFGKFVGDLGIGDFSEIRMRIGVVAEGVAVGDDLFDEIGVLFGPFAGDEHGNAEVIIL